MFRPSKKTTLLLLKGQRGYKGEVYSAIYSNGKSPKKIKITPVTELHLASSYGHLTTSYFNHQIGKSSNSNGNENMFYLISGGLVEVSIHNHHFDNVQIMHESKRGLEKIAQNIGLPKPSKESILELNLGGYVL